MMAGERIVHFESEVVRADGMPVPVSLSLCPVDDYGAGPAGVILARDVTEQRLAQAALAEVEVRLQEGEALAHIGSWLWDLRTGVVQWSTEFHRIHGMDPLDFGGTLQSYLDVVHPEDREPLRAGLEGSAVSGRSWEEDYRVVLPDDQVRVVRVRAQPTIGSAGAVVGLRGVGQDVTHDRRGA
jgi:PAS domain S-box-containing protein